VFQGFVIIAGMLVIFITGVVEVDGFSNVWRINKEMGRTEIFK
jgi:Na+/proline symporter